LAGNYAAVVDEAVAAGDAVELDAIFPANVSSLGGFEIPADERVGGEKASNRDLAFATFAATEEITPLRHGLLAALVTGKLTL
jgi:hypothetical protein